MLDKDKIKQSLTDKDITLILTDLGSNPPCKDIHGNLIFQTVCHNISEGSYKLYYYKESQIFRCYTDCSESFDIYELVMRAKRVRGFIYSFTQAVSYVAHLTGKHYSTTSFSSGNDSFLIDDWEFINRYKKKEKPKVELPEYPKTVLEVFINLPHISWLEEGISRKTIQKYNISYYLKDDRIVIPHYDIHGRLVGIRGRAMRQEDVDAGKKYMPLIVGGQLYNHPTAFNLYGLYENQEAIRRIGKVILFESEKSVLKCEDFYGDNNFSVAVCGSNISNYQRDLILSLGVREIFIGFDKEYTDYTSKEGIEYAEKLLKLAHKFTPYCRVYILFDRWDLLELKDSPADKGKEVLETLMKRKFEIETKKIKEEVEREEEYEVSNNW